MTQPQQTAPQPTTSTKALLELRNISTNYGPVEVLRNINLEARPGEIVCLLGPNAAGKSTTLKTILAMVSPFEGEVMFEGERIDTRTTAHIVSRGISMVPEGRRLFGRMTVRENLTMGSQLRKDKEGIDKDYERVVELFPRL